MNTKLISTIASYTVLLGVSTYFGYLGKSFEMGLAITAGAISLFFCNIEKIKLFKAPGGYEFHMQELRALVDKDTEPEKIKVTNEIANNEDAKKVINALGNPRYTFRYIGGVASDAGISKLRVESVLNELLDKSFAYKTENDRGSLWSLTKKGRNLHASIAVSS